MAVLGANSWGKSEVRVSKVHRGDLTDDFSDVTVSVRLEGDVDAAHTEGDTQNVLPTDTMRNTIYGLAQEHLTKDLEGFGVILAEHFLSRGFVDQADVKLEERVWQRETGTGFLGGGSVRRSARIRRGKGSHTRGGVAGLVVLKTRGSAFTGFPKDQFTILPEKDDRLLATSISAEWEYSEMPEDTAATWGLVCRTMIDSFFSETSASVQHQGYLMGEAVVGAVAEISEISFHLPNQHHLDFDLTRFGLPDHGVVFHPVTEPYGDITLTVRR
ncbi:MAG: factor-independent urate hydroxylase [Acidimicrobiia bacterium]